MIRTTTFTPSADPSRRPAPGLAARLFAVSFALVLGACGGSDGSNGDGTRADLPAPSPNGVADADGNAPPVIAADGALRGTWDRCTGANIRATYVFDGDAFEYYIAYFDSPDCSGEPIREEGLQSPDEIYASGPFRLGDGGTSEEGVAVRPIDIVNANLFGFPVAESIRVTQYDIVHTGVPGQLVFGRSAGNSPDERPTALDFERPYVRR